MSRFTEALTAWFDDHPSISMREIAGDASMSSSLLSLYRSGDRPITQDGIAKLLPAIERASSRTHACSLLIAYLQDETPPHYQPDLHITAIDTGTGHPQRDHIDQLAAKWAQSARHDAEFWAMWHGMDDYIAEAVARESSPPATGSASILKEENQ